MKIFIRIIYVLMYTIIIVTVGGFICSRKTENKIRSDIYGNSESYMIAYEHTVKTYTNSYGTFIDDDMSFFINECSSSFGVDVNLVVSILEQENPLLVFDAVSKPNKDGTVDVGLFQLNDKYLYAKDGFLDKYWDTSLGEFNASNWKHSTYVAIKLIGDLEKMFGEGNIFWIACAYNAGPQRAYKEWTRTRGDDTVYLPESTLNRYAPSVLQNYNKWTKIVDSFK